MLCETVQHLKQDQACYNKETDQLRKLVEEQQKVRKTNEQLRQEEIEFGNVKRDTENRITDERKKVSDLISKLERQMEHQEKEKVTLEGLIAEEKTRLAECQEQLQAKTLQFEN
jgi:chromosome segregation ATPase